MTTTLTGVSSGSVTPVTGPSAGEAVTAASVNTLGKGLVDNDASLNAIKLNLSGGTMTGTITSRDIDVQSTYRLTIDAGADLQVTGNGIVDGDLTFNGAGNVLGAASIITATSGAQIDGTLRYPTTSIVEFLGRTRAATIEDLTDAGHTIVVGTNKQRLRMLTNPAATRTIRFDETGAVAGDWFELTALLGAAGNPVQLERFNNPGTAIALLSIAATGSPALNNVGSVRVQFDGTNWRGEFAGMCCLYGGDW